MIHSITWCMWEVYCDSCPLRQSLALHREGCSREQPSRYTSVSLIKNYRASVFWWQVLADLSDSEAHETLMNRELEEATSPPWKLTEHRTLMTDKYNRSQRNWLGPSWIVNTFFLDTATKISQVFEYFIIIYSKIKWQFKNISQY